MYLRICVLVAVLLSAAACGTTPRRLEADMTTTRPATTTTWRLPKQSTTTASITTQPTTTLPPPSPDVQLESTDNVGNRYELKETIGRPVHFDELDSDVETDLRSCPNVTDRDMVVPVSASMTLKSSIATTLITDYGFGAEGPVLIGYSDGNSCAGSGTDYVTNKELQPGNTATFDYWVVLSGVINPNTPDGDMSDHYKLYPLPRVLQPINPLVSYRAWGTRVVKCDTILGPDLHIWMAGGSPAHPGDGNTQDQCELLNSAAKAFTGK